MGPPLLGLLWLLGGCVLSAGGGGGGDDDDVDAAAQIDAEAPPDADPNAPDADPSAPDAQPEIIDANTGPPDADLLCFGEVAIPIQLGVLHTGSTTGGPSNSTTGCNSGGPEAYHRILLDDTVLPADVTFTTTGGNYDSVLKVLQGCGVASTELFCEDNGGSDDTQTVSLSIPGVYYVLVDSHPGNSGDYGLIVTATPTP